jgi:hypothetical protein
MYKTMKVIPLIRHRRSQLTVFTRPPWDGWEASVLRHKVPVKRAKHARTVGRVIVLGRLKVGTRERAEQLIADAAAADGPEDQFDRVTIFLSDTEVVFSWKAPMRTSP